MLFFNAFSSYIALQKACFGMEKRPHYAELRELRKHVILLPINKLPLKLHVVLAHLSKW